MISTSEKLLQFSCLWKYSMKKSMLVSLMANKTAMNFKSYGSIFVMQINIRLNVTFISKMKLNVNIHTASAVAYSLCYIVNKLSWWRIFHILCWGSVYRFAHLKQYLFYLNKHKRILKLWFCLFQSEIFWPLINEQPIWLVRYVCSLCCLPNNTIFTTYLDPL